MVKRISALEKAKNIAVERVYVSKKNTRNFTVTKEAERFVIERKRRITQ